MAKKTNEGLISTNFYWILHAFLEQTEVYFFVGHCSRNVTLQS